MVDLNKLETPPLEEPKINRIRMLKSLLTTLRKVKRKSKNSSSLTRRASHQMWDPAMKVVVMIVRVLDLRSK